MTDKIEQRIIIPAAKGEWFHIVDPDTKFNAEGEYKVTVYPTQREMEALFEPLKAMAEEALAAYQEEENEKAKAKKVKPKILKLADNQPWTAQETEEGTLVLKLKRKARITKKDGTIEDIQMKVVDGKGNSMTPEQVKATRAGNGSVVRCVVTAFPYNMASVGVGISLRLEKVQLLKVVAYGGNSGPDNELGEYEGSDFVAAPASSTPSDPDFAPDDQQGNYTV